METHGPMSAAEASAALASVERSRARVAVVAAALVFVLFAGTAFTFSARAAHR
jgi:hypothetical protein